METKQKYLVVIAGCDDTTYLEIEMTTDEHRFFEHLSNQSVLMSMSGCQPTIRISSDKYDMETYRKRTGAK